MRQPPPHGAGQNPGLMAPSPGGPLRGGSAIAVARAVAMARRQSVAPGRRGTSTYGSPSSGLRGPRPPMLMPRAPGAGTALLQAAAPAAPPAPVVPPAPAQGAVPGSVPGGAAEPSLEDIEAQILVEQALYELTQKPIIPNALVFTCAACYLLFVGSALVIGSVYFTYRLQPATPPDPPAQTDTTVTFLEGLTKATTQSPKNWIVSSDVNPLICLVDFIVPANPTLVTSLVSMDICNRYYMNEALEYDSQGEMTLAGQKGQRSVDGFLSATYGTHSGVLKTHTGPIMLTAYGPNTDLQNAVQNDVFNLKGIYLRLKKNWDSGAVAPFLDEVVLVLNGDAVLEVEAADIPKITRDIQEYIKIMVVVSPGMTKDSLDQLKVATLANPFPVINDTISKAVKQARKLVCVAFSMSALKSASAKGKIDKAGDPADLVTPVKQSEVCSKPRPKNDRQAVSLYQPGAPFYSFDTNRTMFEKVRRLLTEYNNLCIAALTVFHDNCPNFNLLKIMKIVFDKNFK